MLDLMTARPIAANQHWCGKCMCYFSSKYNLQRHQLTTINACRFNDNTVTPRKVVDKLTGKLRYRTPDEQRKLARVRNTKRYWDVRWAYNLF